MRQWIAMVWYALLLIVYVCAGLAVVAAAGWAVSAGRYVATAAIVLGGGSLVLGTSWHVIKRWTASRR